MVIVAIRALELEYLVRILDWGRSQGRYICTDSDSDSTALLVTRSKILADFQQLFPEKKNRTFFLENKF
jgi:hypothetical protein